LGVNKQDNLFKKGGNLVPSAFNGSCRKCCS